MKNVGIILAAGSGTRVGNPIPKQFLEINGKPILAYSLETFSNCKSIDEIVLTINPQFKDKYLEILNKYHSSKNVILIDGGLTRQDSVKNAINYIAKNNEEAIILVHDAARPFVSEKIILDNINAVRDYKCCTTAVSSSNSIYITNKGQFVEEADRKNIYIAQTPQSGLLSIFKEAYAKIDEIFTDEAALFSKLGYVPHIVIGEEKNKKITFKEDLKNI